MHTLNFQGRSYQITFDSRPDHLKKQLSEPDLKSYLKLLEQAQIHPKEVYGQIKEFCEKHLHVAEVVNLLTFAHIQNFKIREAETLIEKTFIDHPDYLFARVNFADQVLRKKQLDKIKEIFPTFNLHELFPEKSEFHASEFRAFVVMLGFYYLALKDQTAAIECLEVAKEIEPHDQSVIFLEKKIYRRSLLQRLLSRITLKK